MYTKLPDTPATAGARGVRRDRDGAVIPADPANHDWQAYQAWLEAGNVPAPAPKMPDTATPDTATQDTAPPETAAPAPKA